MPAVIYARKSTDRGERQVQSLDDQVRALRELATRDNLTVSEIITESRSAKAPGARPEFQRLVSRVELGEVDAILTWSMNRLSRNLVDGGIVAHLLQTGKLKAIHTPERTYLPEDNVLVISVENGMATSYLQDLSRNVKRGMRGKVERGWRPGRVPIGYVNNPKTREIDIDPVMFPIMRRGWELLLTGDSTPVEVTRELTRLGLRKPNGQSLGHSAIYKILRNPFYAGRLLESKEPHLGKHVAMITPAEFESAQCIMKQLPNRRAKTHDHTFAGTFTCAVCGCKVVAETKRKTYPGSGRVATYTYYHCSGWKGCPKRSVSEQDITSAILQAAADSRIEPAFGDFVARALRDSAQQDEDVVSGSPKSIEVAIAATTKRLKRARELLIEGTLDAADYAETKAEAEQKVGKLRAKLSEAETESQQIDALIERRLEAAVRANGAAELDARGLRALAVALTDERYLNLGKVEMRLDPVLQKIATFEPHWDGSQSLESGYKSHDHSFWWWIINEARNVARKHLRQMRVTYRLN